MVAKPALNFCDRVNGFINAFNEHMDFNSNQRVEGRVFRVLTNWYASAACWAGVGTKKARTASFFYGFPLALIGLVQFVVAAIFEQITQALNACTKGKLNKTVEALRATRKSGFQFMDRGSNNIITLGGHSAQGFVIN